MITTDILIIGAGASGLTCAARAASGGHSVTLIEGEEKPARKILVSGGGKCNFTNMEVTPANYICENKHFCKSALARWSQWDTISAFAEWGIPYEEREEGRLFCLRSAADVTKNQAATCIPAQK
jgi:predicted flavoprotein YhiN